MLLQGAQEERKPCSCRNKCICRYMRFINISHLMKANEKINENAHHSDWYIFFLLLFTEGLHNFTRVYLYRIFHKTPSSLSMEQSTVYIEPAACLMVVWNINGSFRCSPVYRPSGHKCSLRSLRTFLRVKTELFKLMHSKLFYRFNFTFYVQILTFLVLWGKLCIVILVLCSLHYKTQKTLTIHAVYLLLLGCPIWSDVSPEVLPLVTSYV